MQAFNRIRLQLNNRNIKKLQTKQLALRPINLKKKMPRWVMNSDKTYKWVKMKCEIMNIKVEVNMMKAVIIKQ